MRIVHREPRRCPCDKKREAFLREEATAGVVFAPGSILECDCGQRFKLIDDQRDGEVWQWYHPDSGDMSKR